MSAAVKTEIEAFATDGGPRGTVHVRTVDDLSEQFKRGGVSELDAPNAEAVMVLILGVDGEPIDLILHDGESFMFDALTRAKMAIELALEGYARS